MKWNDKHDILITMTITMVSSSSLLLPLASSLTPPQSPSSSSLSSQQPILSWASIDMIRIIVVVVVVITATTSKQKQKNWLYEQKNSSARISFPWRPLHDYDVKHPNATFHGGPEHTTTNFPFSFWSWIKSLLIQLKEKSPAFDKLGGPNRRDKVWIDAS